MNHLVKAPDPITTLIASSLALLFSPLCHAQAASTLAPADTTTGSLLSEVVVSASKQTENALDVPISVTVFTKSQLNSYNIRTFNELAAATPGLILNQSFGDTGNITIRGVGAGSFDAANDQDVLLVLDGVGIPSGTAVHFGQFDLDRVEVLKGPQPLYYGESSIAGAISTVSADPTNTFYGMARAGYESQADEYQTEAVISGPIADGVLGRVALYRDSMQGYFPVPYSQNPVQPVPVSPEYGPLVGAEFTRIPADLDQAVRGTLKLEPNERLTATLKATYETNSGSPADTDAQYFYCPAGVPAPGNPGNVPGVGVCKLGYAIPVGPNITAQQSGNPLFRNGEPYRYEKQFLAVSDISYKLADDLTLNSVSGFYNLDSLDGSNGGTPYPAISSVNDIWQAYLSQEIRLSSNYDSPFNWMFGVFYQKQHFREDNPVAIGSDLLPTSSYRIPGDIYSAFAQARYDITKTLELTAGGRFTSEGKQVKMYSNAINAYVTNLAVNSETFNTFSPAVTLSWRPTAAINVYGSFKEGEKAGGFNTSSTVFPPFAGLNIAYADEHVSGFEGGVKTLLLENTLSFDIDAYDYEYENLQVGQYDVETGTEYLRNAASATSRGVEAAATYLPPVVNGLTISGSVNYNRARYGKYLAVCYVGQTIAEGCNAVVDGEQYQNLAGAPLERAPDWTGGLSAEYHHSISANSGTNIGLMLSAVYTGSYQPIADEPPDATQSASTIFDAEIRLFNDADQGWELALIGQNLTNVLRVQVGVEAPFTPGPAVNAGTGTDGPGIRADLIGFTNNPRTIWVRATKYF